MTKGLLARLGWWDALREPGPRRVLAWNALIDSAGLGLTAICLPFFMLKALDLDASEFALAITLAGAAELLATVPAGAIAGRVGVQRYSVITRVARALILLVLAGSGQFAVVVALLVLLGLFRAATFGLSQSLVAAVVGQENRGGVIAVNRALRNVGYIVAGSVGAVVVSLDSDLALRVALAFNALTYAASAWLYSRLRSPRTPQRPDRLDWSVLRDHKYFALSALGGAFASTILILDVALPLWVVQRGLPPWVVGVVAVVNTTLVVVLQVSFSTRAETVPGSLSLLRTSTVFFLMTSVCFALSQQFDLALATAMVLLGGVFMTFAELTEGPAWWTLSYEMAPPERADEYLAAYDLSEGVLNVAGPLVMLAVVAGGSGGWLAYGVLITACLFAAQVVVARIEADRSLVAVDGPQ